MKKTFTLLVLFILSMQVYGQSDTLSTRKYRLGAEVSSIQSLQTGLYINPTVHVSKGKSELFFGPKILTPIEIGNNLQVIDKPIQRYGVAAGYKFYPTARQKRFNFYFHYLIQYHKFGTSISQELINNQYYDRKNEVHLENTIGYGFKYSITKHIYLNQNVGAGIAHQWATYQGFKGTKWVDGNFSIRLGIGYEIR